jgi:hypothetical protein
MINIKNWNSSYYTNPQKMKAFISLIADPELNSGEIFYGVTLTTEQNTEIHQECHPNLNAACQSINEKFKHWNLKSTVAGDGCGSCSAH